MKPFATLISEKNYEGLKRLAHKTGLKLTWLINDALKRYLKIKKVLDKETSQV